MTCRDKASSISDARWVIFVLKPAVEEWKDRIARPLLNGETAIARPQACGQELPASKPAKGKFCSWIHMIDLWRLRIKFNIALKRYFGRYLGSYDKATYYHDPQRGLYGIWDPAERMIGLDKIIIESRGKSVLDAGCAEGFVAEAFLKAGAAEVTAFDINPSRVKAAAALIRDPRFEVSTVDLCNTDFFDDRARYDIVAYLSVHQHLPEENRLRILQSLLDICNETFVFRTNAKLLNETVPDILSRGFELHNLDADNRIATYRRVQASPLNCAA